MDSIKNSKKAALQLLAKEASRDVRSITGCNLRNIMLLLGETKVENIKKEDGDTILYSSLDSKEAWKVATIKEIIETRTGKITIEGFTKTELDEMLEYLCTD